MSICARETFKDKRSMFLSTFDLTHIPVVQLISTPHNAHGTASFRSKREWHMVLKVEKKIQLSLAHQNVQKPTVNYCLFRDFLISACTLWSSQLVFIPSLISMKVEMKHLSNWTSARPNTSKLSRWSTMMTTCTFLSLSLCFFTA
jgi:hypothetical protein